MSYRATNTRRWASLASFLPYTTRFLGVATAVVLWGIGFDMVYNNHILGRYIIAFSLLLFFFEITWVISLFIDLCIKSDHSPLLSFWSVVTWFDSWKKAVVYWTLATVLIVKPHKLWLTTISGGMLVVLGLLHFLQGIQGRMQVKDTLLPQSDDHYDRFDEETESLNGDVSNDQESESVSNNEYIMQV